MKQPTEDSDVDLSSGYIDLVLHGVNGAGIKINGRQGARSYAEPSLLPREYGTRAN